MDLNDTEYIDINTNETEYFNFTTNDTECFIFNGTTNATKVSDQDFMLIWGKFGKL